MNKLDVLVAAACGCLVGWVAARAIDHRYVMRAAVGDPPAKMRPPGRSFAGASEATRAGFRNSTERSDW